MAQQISPETMKRGLERLDQLALSEYGRSLPEIAASLRKEEGDSPLALFSPLSFGRLLGILIKEPFSVHLDPEPGGTRRRWELLPERLKERDAQATWQFQVIAQLQEDSEKEPFEAYSTVEAMLEEVKRETGFFWHLLRSTRKCVCGDPEIAGELQEKMDELHHRSGTAVTLPSASNAATLGALLAGHAQFLRVADPALVAGIVVLLWEMGCDRFCSWSLQIITSRVWFHDS